QLEKACLESEMHLAEVAACHQILTLIVTEPVRVPPTARKRMYALVQGVESLPNKKPGAGLAIVNDLPEDAPGDPSTDAGLLLGMKAYSRSDPPIQRILKWAILVTMVLLFGVSAYLAVPSSNPPPLKALAPAVDDIRTR
ncbi:MAG: hypothetical protein ACRCZF_22345, partial [Gemmataceae bacterium]